MARQFDKPLEDMTRDELFAVAQEMQIKGRDRMKKPELLEAVQEVLTRPETTGEEQWEWDLVRRSEGEGTEGDSGPEGGSDDSDDSGPDSKPDVAPPGPLPPAELTDEDKLLIQRATDAELEAVLTDPASTGPARAFVEQERDQRKRRRERVREQARLRSPVTQYRITSGPAAMRYVTRDGFMTQLPIGSVIGPFTHDLQHLSEAGFTWERIRGVEVTHDQLGNEVSTAK